MGDALALRGDEGRDKLRKATGMGTYQVIRRYPNGATPYLEEIRSTSFRSVRQTQGTETSKYLQEQKITMIPQVVASERGGAQTGLVTASPGL